MMKHLVIVHGWKGGVGKSTFAIAAAGHLLQHLAPMDLALYDLDGVKGDLFRHFSHTVALSTDDIEKTDDLGGVLDNLMSDIGPRAALLDAPANGKLTEWLVRLGPGQAARRGELAIHILWVLDGSERSGESLTEEYGMWVAKGLVFQMTVIRNLGRNRFFLYDQMPISETLRQAGVPVIAMPACNELAMQEAQIVRDSYHHYVEDRATGSRARRETVASWLTDLQPAFARLSCITEGLANAEQSADAGNAAAPRQLPIRASFKGARSRPPHAQD
jgi:hypothetical protein